MWLTLFYIILLFPLLLLILSLKYKFTLFHSWVAEEIKQLDPKVDFERIMFLLCAYDFPFDFLFASQIALFKTFAIPSIGSLLHRTKNFEKNAQKRYDDTNLLFGYFVDYGFMKEGSRGDIAIKRMNEIHGKYSFIKNEDYMYVLWTIIFTGRDFVNKFGFKKLMKQEEEGIFWFWINVGKKMNIQNLPEDSAIFYKWGLEYEKKHFRKCEPVVKVANATLRLFTSWFPQFMEPIAKNVVFSFLQDDLLLDAIDAKKPPSWFIKIVFGIMYLRAALLRLLPRRSKKNPFIATKQYYPTYPLGNPDILENAKMYGPQDTQN